MSEEITWYIANPRRVWVRTGTVFEPYRLIDPSPVEANDENDLGHRWTFDGCASDPDDPMSCFFCGRPRWKALHEECEVGAERANAERGAWIEANRWRGEGRPPGAYGPDIYRENAERARARLASAA